MKDYKRLTRKKEITECEIVDDKRYSVGFKQIPHKINKNIIKGIYTICNDMDGQGDYIKGDIVDKIAELEDKIESGEIDYVADKDKEVARLTAENAQLREEVDNLSHENDELEYKTERLEIENAELIATISKMETVEKELRARLEKAVDPQLSNGDKAYAIMDTLFFTDVFPVEIKSVDIVYEVFDGEQMTTQHRTRIFTDRAAAEKRLAELKGLTDEHL